MEDLVGVAGTYRMMVDALVVSDHINCQDQEEQGSRSTPFRLFDVIE